MEVEDKFYRGLSMKEGPFSAEGNEGRGSAMGRKEGRALQAEGLASAKP